MSQRDDSRQDHDSRRLQELEQRLREREAAGAVRRGPKDQGQMSALGAAWRMSIELVVALGVGGGLGYLLDRLLHTNPWIMLVGLAFGFAAGVRSVVRTAYRMQVPPTGGPVKDDRSDED